MKSGSFCQWKEGKEHGWTLKCFGRRRSYLRTYYVRSTRKEVIETFEKIMGKGSWPKYRRAGSHKIVKVMLVEIIKIKGEAQ